MSEPDRLEDAVRRLTKRLERERRARLHAEAIAEQGLRDLFDRQQELLLSEAIAEAANTAASVEAAMGDALRIICQYTGWPVGHAWLTVSDLDGVAVELVSTNVWRVKEPLDVRRLQDASHRIRLPSDRFLKQLVLTASPAWVLDVAAASFPRGSDLSASGLGAAFAFPILVATEVVAVLEFFASHAVAPSTRLVEVLTHVGTQLGRVIERKRAHDHLVDAFHDPLTHLPNRALFLRQLQSALARLKRNPCQLFAVLFLDVDDFKMVNDSLGHLAGDQLIIQIGQRLMGSLRCEDTVARAAVDRGSELQGTVARLGGDEFTILLNDVRHITDSVRVAERVQAAVEPPFVVDGVEIFTSLSIGIAMSDSRHVAAEDVLRDADLAMYRAKLQGKGRCELFDPAMQAAAVARLRLETDLRHALQRDELALVYQPIVALGTGRIAGIEALLRWNHPDRGLISPADFIPIAEDTGAILAIGDWVLRTSCEQLREWQKLLANETLFVALNVSAKQFTLSGFGQQLADVLAGTDLPPRSVMLELTEGVAMGNAERSREVLCGIKALGVRVTIDDFGTGFSSLSYLTRFPVDGLKVDRSFVTRMEEHDHSREVVKTIVTLGHNLGLEVTAEGAETEGQVRDVQRLGCHYAQGNFLGRPAGPTEVRSWLVSQPPYGGLGCI